MSFFLMRFGPAVLCILLLGVPLASASSPSPSASVGNPGTAPPDTVQAAVTAGAPLVHPLPTRLQDAPVARYTVLKGPSLSGAAGYSFTWITRDTAPGTYAIPLRAAHPDAAADTLIVRVTVQPE